MTTDKKILAAMMVLKKTAKNSTWAELEAQVVFEVMDMIEAGTDGLGSFEIEAQDGEVEDGLFEFDF